MEQPEMSFEQRLELVDIELKEIAKIIDEMAESLSQLGKMFGKSE